MPTELPMLDRPLRSHEDVIARAQAIGESHGLARVAIAAAEEDDVLAALHECKRQGIADALLVGNEANILAALDTAGVPRDRFEIIGTTSDEESALTTARLAAEGRADVVMKGFIKTGTLLKTLLKSEHGLRDRELVSHSALLYVPAYGKLINLTDGGTIPVPTLAQKTVIAANAVRVLRAVGVERPRIAVFGPSETVSPTHPLTGDARALADLLRIHWEDEVIVDGPLPLDLAIRKPADLGMPHAGPVAGDADILLVHSLEEGNITAKTLIQFGDAIFMGVIAGAKVPISLVSRSDTMMNKMASVALAVCLADYQRRDLPALTPIPVPEEDAR